MKLFLRLFSVSIALGFSACKKGVLLLACLLTLSGTIQAVCYPQFYIKGGNKSIELISKSDLNNSVDIMIVGAEPDSLVTVEVSISYDGVLKKMADSWQDGVSEKIKSMLINAPIGATIYIGGTFKVRGRKASIPNNKYKVCKKKDYKEAYLERAKLNYVMINNPSSFGDKYYFQTMGDARVSITCENVRRDIKVSAFSIQIFDENGQSQFQKSCTTALLSKDILEAIESNVSGKILINKVHFVDAKGKLIPGEPKEYVIVK